MAKYVMKAEVEAIQFDGKLIAGIEINEEKKQNEAGYFFMRKENTKVPVLVGDYLVERIGGDVSVVPKAEFEATFKPAPVTKKLEEALNSSSSEEMKADSERVANTKGHKQKK